MKHTHTTRQLAMVRAYHRKRADITEVAKGLQGEAGLPRAVSVVMGTEIKSEALMGCGPQFRTLKVAHLT